MGEKDAPKEMSVSERIAAAADASRRERELRGEYEEPRRSEAWEDLGGMGQHPFDKVSEKDPLNVDGIPTLPDPNPNRPADPPSSPDEEHTQAMQRNIDAARKAISGGSNSDKGSAHEAPDPRSQ